MDRLTSAVHWWEESQMRVLVLGSLVVQVILFFFTFARTRVIPGWIRFIIWLAYLGGDAIAIYALATLFNRHKEQDQEKGGYGGGGSNTLLEVVWAPVLLIHLGGHDGITAYNIEDNELWTRHLLTAVSQVTVAIYVFWKSWPQGGDKRLLQAAIMLFVPGVLKCFAKPWALMAASIKSLVSSPSTESIKQEAKRDITSLEEYVQRRAKASVREEDEGNQNEGEMNIVFEQYVEGAIAFVKEQQKHGEQKDEDEGAQGNDTSSSQHHRQVKEEKTNINILNGWACKLFVDLSSPYSLRLSIFKCFWVLSEVKVEKAYGCVRQGLASAFFLLYTKVKVSFFDKLRMDMNLQEVRINNMMSILFSYSVAASRCFLPWAAIGLFHHSHREAYSGIDVKITYALFCCTAVLELYSQACLNQLDDGQPEWPEMVAQYNLIGYYARSKNHSSMMWFAKKSGCKDFLDQHWCMESCFSSGTITKLVLQYLKDGWKEISKKTNDGWKEEVHNTASYHKFNDNRGQWALKGNEQLDWSIKRPFDESVLLWHIATDLCFFSGPSRKAVQCRQMSNYMVYLLFVNPEMLLPGTRRYLFTTAYDELKDILGDNKLNPKSCCCCCCQQVVDKGLMKTLIDTMQIRPKKQDPEGQPKGGSKGTFIEDAWDLAEELTKLRDNFGEEKMWKVIQGVWVEMLCFSASRCRGYLHAKALSSGGEFLSYVWLLLFYMGMETFTERLERGREVVFPCHQGNNSASQAPRASDAHNGSGTASPSASRIRGPPSPSRLDTGTSPSN